LISCLLGLNFINTFLIFTFFCLNNYTKNGDPMTSLKLQFYISWESTKEGRAAQNCKVFWETLKECLTLIPMEGGMDELVGSSCRSLSLMPSASGLPRDYLQLIEICVVVGRWIKSHLTALSLTFFKVGNTLHQLISCFFQQFHFLQLYHFLRKSWNQF
jgi:hypothetical protein